MDFRAVLVSSELRLGRLRLRLETRQAGELAGWLSEVFGARYQGDTGDDDGGGGGDDDLI